MTPEVESLNGEFVPQYFLHIIVCVDPNPYSEYGSGSTKLLNMDPIWIRIHNTGSNR